MKRYGKDHKKNKTIENFEFFYFSNLKEKPNRTDDVENGKNTYCLLPLK